MKKLYFVSALFLSIITIYFFNTTKTEAQKGGVLMPSLNLSASVPVFTVSPPAALPCLDPKKKQHTVEEILACLPNSINIKMDVSIPLYLSIIPGGPTKEDIQNFVNECFSQKTGSTGAFNCITTYLVQHTSTVVLPFVVKELVKQLFGQTQKITKAAGLTLTEDDAAVFIEGTMMISTMNNILDIENVKYDQKGNTITGTITKRNQNSVSQNP